MDNKTTMPGLLTLPGELGAERYKARTRPLYKLIFALAVFALVTLLYLI